MLAFKSTFCITKKDSAKNISVSHTVSSFYLSRLTAAEACAFRIAAITCAVTFYTDLASLAFLAVIIDTFTCLAADIAEWIWCAFIHFIGISTGFSLLKTLTACLPSISGIASTYIDRIQFTVELFVVYACVYATS